jgi:unsaturated rhamnogalacturonyl hydrolase
LGWVQRVGVGPDQVDKDDTQLYGVGAFLLAASEVSKLSTAKQKHCLPLRSSALR